MSDFITMRDKLAYTGEHPWHIGETGRDGRSVFAGDEAQDGETLRQIALPWEPVKVPLVFLREAAELRVKEDASAWLKADRDLRSAEAFAILRDDGGDVLTQGRAVSEAFTPFLNRDLVKLGDLLVDNGEARWHTMGSLKGGRHVYGSIQAAGAISVRDDMDRVIDEVAPFLMLFTAHDGTHSLECMFTTVRPVCHNTVSFARQQAKGKAAKLRHTVQLSDVDGVAERITEILGLARDSFAVQAEVANSLAKIRMTTERFAEFAMQLVLDKPSYEEAAVAYGKLTKRSKENAEEKAAKLLSCIESSKQRELPDTAYKAVQGVAEFIDWQRNRTSKWLRKNKQLGLDSALFGEGAKLKQKAQALLLAKRTA